MRLGPSSNVLAVDASWDCRVTSSLAGKSLADGLPIPVVGGRATWSIAQQIPDQVRITVPRESVESGRSFDWLPVTANAPLNRYGQVLDVTVTVEGVDSRLGRYLITDWAYDESVVEVSGTGLLQVAAESRLPVVTTPRDNGTLRSEFVRLLPEQMSAQFDGALVDRACPRTMEWDEDRIGALYEIADAWPARLRMDAWGQVLLKPPLPTYPTSTVLSFKDGARGTVVSVPREETRDRTYNHVVARSSADGVTAWNEAVQTSGPMAVQTYGRVTKFFASPLLLTEAQCAAAAQSQLNDSLRPARTIKVTAAPDPRVELDDPVEVWRDGIRDWGFVVGVEMPLTVNDGPMRVDVGVIG